MRKQTQRRKGARTQRSPVGAIIRLGVVFLVLLPAYSFQGIKKGQAVYAVALRDSHFLTMRVSKEKVSMPGGFTWQSAGNAEVSYRFEGRETIQFFDASRTSFVNPTWIAMPEVTLPLPAAMPSPGQSWARTLPGREELDRMAPDPDIQSRLVKEFRDRKEYAIVDSLDNADLVFLAEGTYDARQVWTEIKVNEQGRKLPEGVVTSPVGDRKAGFLQAVLAIVVPADVYRREAGNASALVAARLWEGSSVWQYISTSNGPGAKVKYNEIDSASPEAVVRQFHKKEKRPASHFPLCAATALTLRAQGSETDVRLGVGAAEAAGKSAPAGTALVTMPVSVVDEAGYHVADLKDSDFRLFEGDRNVPIERIIPGSEPVNLTLMIDTSLSMRLQTPQVQDAVLAFVEAARPQDRLMIVSFDDRIFVSCEFSDTRDAARRAVYLVRRTGEGTRLYDAMELAIKDRIAERPGRKALVLFTDGVDTRSRLSGMSQALGAVRSSGAILYAIQYDTQAENTLYRRPDLSQWLIVPDDIANNDLRYARADRFLQDLSRYSGGELLLAGEGADLKQVFSRIMAELTHQYTICYRAADAGDAVRVEVGRPNVRVRAGGRK